MPGTRDHEPVVIEDFNGLWDRGDHESVPLDHFHQADNIQYIHSGFETRDVIQPFEQSGINTAPIERMYNYVTKRGQSLLVLVSGRNVTNDIIGTIYHIVENGVFSSPILGPIVNMTDFGFVAYNGRAFITP